jgi:hypothetical protein
MTRAKGKQGKRSAMIDVTVPEMMQQHNEACLAAGVDPRCVPTTEKEIMDHPMVKDYVRLWDKLEKARTYNEYEPVNIPLTDYDIRQLQFGLQENRKRLIKALTELESQDPVTK